MMRSAGVFLLSILAAVAMTLAACGGGSAEIENNCQTFCEWSHGCIAEASENSDQQVTPSWGGAQGVEGCISQCVQSNEPLYDFHRSCYDATWDFYAGCLTQITCEELQEDGDVVTERCDDVADRTEQICEQGAPQ